MSNNYLQDISAHRRLASKDFDDQTRVVLDDLWSLAELFESNNYRVGDLTRALGTDNESELWEFLTSNTLWGGMGSIADQALIESPEARRKVQEILIRIGRAQKRYGCTNLRTEMWVSAFEKFRIKSG